MTLCNLSSITVVGSEKSEKKQARRLICEDEPTEISLFCCQLNVLADLKKNSCQTGLIQS